MEIKKVNLKWNGTLTPLERVEKLIQHHMAHTSWDIYDVHRYHRDHNKWFGIGYNYWIGFDGNIYEARGENQGAHSGSRWNRRSLGIGYQGNFETQRMTTAQLNAAGWLNAKLINKYNLSLEDIIGHKDVSSTACPGRNFNMNELKKKASEALAQFNTNSNKSKETGAIYRVQIGAFSSYDNAEKYAAKAEKDGFETLIGIRNNLFIVQIGAFREKNNAERLSKEANSKGYNTFISQEPLGEE